MNPIIVVFGGDDYNTLGLIRSLGEKGLVPNVLLSTIYPIETCFLKHSTYIGTFNAFKTEREAVQFLEAEYAQEAKVIVFCASDKAITALDQYQGVLRGKLQIFNAGESGRLSKFLDKSTQFALAERCGIRLIRTWHVDDAGKVPDDVVFPCLVKGNNSLTSYKSDIKVCENKNELMSWILPGKDYLIQEYIKKDFEININGLSINHGRDILIPGAVRKIREEFNRQSDYIVLEKIPEGFDIDAIKRLVLAIGYEGLFSVEFMKKGDKFYFLEINLRNDGVNYLYTLGGVNMPELWLKYVKGELLSFDDYRLSIKTPLYLMQHFDVFNLKNGKVGVKQWMMDFFSAHAHFVLNMRDPKPFICMVSYYLGRLLKKVIKL